MSPPSASPPEEQQESSFRLRAGLVLASLAIGATWLWREPSVPLGGWAIAPPCVALVLALITARPALSMLVGAVVGTLALSPTLAGLGSGIVRHGVQNVLDVWHLCAMGFALSLLGMVQLMSYSGGTTALLRLASRRVGSARGAKLSTAVSGLVVFFDDYANVLMVGPTLRPLTDRYGVSREKLAYIVDCTAAPVAGLSVLSTWVAYEVGLFEELLRALELPGGGYSLLLSALPFRFYCVFALMLVFLTSALGRDLPPMLGCERRAASAAKDEGAAVVEATTPAGRAEQPGPRMWLAALVPLGTLLASVPVGLLVDGGWMEQVMKDPGSLLRLHTYRDSLQASSHSIQVLLACGVLASLVALLTPYCLDVARRRESRYWTEAGRAYLVGARAGLGPLTILITAWALAGVCKDLRTGAYLVQVLGGGLQGTWIPVGSFALAAVVAFCTGTSWGTMAILIPTVATVAYSTGGHGLLVLTVASVLDGAIFGDHCSPISDTTVMTCVATGCSLTQHVKTQMPYALSAMIVAASAGYIQVAATGALWLGYLLGLLGLVALVALVARPVVRSTSSAYSSAP